jgi:uncharacterized protein YggT (Ycf19 family)
MLIRIIFSWTGFDTSNPIYQAVFEITEPFLAPIRQFARVGMMDLSPMVATFILIFIAQAASRL